jgi:hypothetical protein
MAGDSGLRAPATCRVSRTVDLIVSVEHDGKMTRRRLFSGSFSRSPSRDQAQWRRPSKAATGCGSRRPVWRRIPKVWDEATGEERADLLQAVVFRVEMPEKEKGARDAASALQAPVRWFELNSHRRAAAGHEPVISHVIDQDETRPGRKVNRLLSAPLLHEIRSSCPPFQCSSRCSPGPG